MGAIASLGFNWWLSPGLLIGRQIKVDSIMFLKHGEDGCNGGQQEKQWRHLMHKYTVAIDLGKWKHAISIYDVTEHKLVTALSIGVNRAGFLKLDAALEALSPRAFDFVIGCEATGHYGETLLRHLQKQNYPIVRLNPAQVTQFRRGLGRRAKNDELDADAMARQLAVGSYTHEHPLSETVLALRRVTRLRLDFVEEKGRWANRVLAVINQMFPEVEPLLKDVTTPTTLAILQAYPSRQRLATAPIDELSETVGRASRRNKGAAFAKQLQQTAAVSVGLDDPHLEMELRILVQQVISATESIRHLEKEIKQLTDQVLVERSRQLALEQPLTLDDFPLGTHLSIGTLLAEMGCVERFETQKQMLSYFGWCPNTKESGTQKSPHPRMSHQGNRFARRIIWMLAVGAIRWVPEYQDYFNRRVDNGKNKMKTIVAVGRKLLCTIRAILLTGQPYDSTRYLGQPIHVAVT